MNCALHRQFKLQYFCQTCLDPVCQQCIRSNPHSNEYHKIESIQNAVQNRKQRFQLYINNEINPLRQKYQQKLQFLKEIQSQQQQAHNAILKDITLQFQAIDHRTKQKAQKQISQYQTQIKYYQSYLNTIDDLAYTFQSTSQDPYNFLILYQDFNNQLRSLELKQIKQKIDNFNHQEQQQNVEIKKTSQLLMISTQNQPNCQQIPRLYHNLQFPRQIKQTYQQLATLKNLRFRNQFANALIAEACQNYQNQKKSGGSSTLQKYKNQLTKYNQTNQNILKLKSCKSCVFCQDTLTIQNLNEQCQKNKSFKVQISSSYSHIHITPDFKGTKRHFWVDSSPNNRKIPDIQLHQMIRIKLKKDFYNSLKALSVIKCCFRKYQIDNVKNDSQKISFLEPFQNADKQKKGVISKISFKYILSKTFNMQETNSDILIQLLSYNWKPTMQILREQNDREIKEIKPNFPQKLQAIDGVNYTLLEDFTKNQLFFYQIFQEIQKQLPIAPQSKDVLRKYKY